MDDKKSNQIIGFAVVAIVAYYVLQMIVPILVWGVIGLVGWRVYQELKKRN